MINHRVLLAWTLALALSAGILPGAFASVVTAHAQPMNSVVIAGDDDDWEDNDNDDDDWDDDDWDEVPPPVPTVPVVPNPVPTREPVIVPTITPIVGSADDADIAGMDDGDDDRDDDDTDDVDDDDLESVEPAIEPDDDDDDIDDLDQPIADRAVVRFTAGADPRDIADRSGTELLRVVTGIDIALLGLDPERPDTDELAELTTDPDVIWGELNFTQQAPEGRPRYFFTSTASVPRLVDGPALPSAVGWDPTTGCIQGDEVVVAVLDTGIDRHHPMFEGSLSTLGVNLIDPTAGIDDAGNEIDDDGDGSIDEMVGHGTHVSGTILQVAPGATILPVTVLNSDGVGDAFTVTAGITHAINAGADVINLSLGSTYDSLAIRDAIGLASDRGVTVVAAAGNAARSQPLEYPAANDGVISVAATTDIGDRAAFSNFNPTVDLSAPGLNVASAFPDGRYATASGTSMSAPIVAGAIALLLASTPDLSPAQAIQALADGSAPFTLTDPTNEGMLGAGILDISASISCD